MWSAQENDKDARDGPTWDDLLVYMVPHGKKMTSRRLEGV